MYSFNSEVSGFAGQAEMFCSIKALPVMTRTEHRSIGLPLTLLRLFHVDGISRMLHLFLCLKEQEVRQFNHPKGGD